MALTPIGGLYFASLVQLVLWSPSSTDTIEENFDKKTISTTEIPAQRGSILDRHGLALAEDRCTWNLVINFLPEHRSLTVAVEDGSMTPEQAIARVRVLAEGTGVPFTELWSALMVNPNGYQVLRRGLTMTERDLARQAMKRVSYSGLRLEQEFTRAYPNGPVLSHLIGLVEREPVKMIDEKGQRGTGFEQGLNDLLQGVPGERSTIAVTGKHGVNPALGMRDAVPGRSIRTSLDLELSEFARGQLAELMEEHNPWRCLAIAVEVKTGQILLIMGLPDYDPNDPLGTMEVRLDPVTGIEGPDGWTNPARWHFEPGSSMKPLVAAYALERGAIKANQRFSNDGGSFLPPNSARGDAIGNSRGVPNKDMRAYEGIVYSSNIVFAKIARAIGREGMADMMDFFGYPAEKYQLLGNDQYFMPRQMAKRSAFFSKRSPDGMAYTIPRMGYGHAVDVPPLHHAMAMASIANGGTLLEPTFNPQAEPEVIGQIFSQSTTDYVKDAMLWMVNKENRRWLPHRDDMAYCGKSGTADIRSGAFEGKYTSTFVCYGPYEDPEILVLVVAYGTTKQDVAGTHHYGSKVAGPAAANILHRALELRGSLPINGSGDLDWGASPANLDR